MFDVNVLKYKNFMAHIFIMQNKDQCQVINKMHTRISILT